MYHTHANVPKFLVLKQHIFFTELMDLEKEHYHCCGLFQNLFWARR